MHPRDDKTPESDPFSLAKACLAKALGDPAAEPLKEVRLVTPLGNGPKIQVDASTTVEQLKTYISQKIMTRSFTLYHGGRELQSDGALSDYNVRNHDLILIWRLPTDRDYK